MADGKTYQIEKVADFLAVPLDDLRECLDNFTHWLALHHVMRERLKGIPLQNDPERVFAWTNDGENTATFRVMRGGETVMEHKFEVTP